MPAALQHIPLDALKVSRLNVRKHGAKDVASLASSIAALGLLQPLLVRETGNGYEVVAGQRRYLAARALRQDGHDAADPVPCVLLAAGDDAAAIEASLAENIERLPMDEMDQHEAFLALRRKGLAVADIAAHFAISERIVERRLALANLIPDIRRLYRQGEIDARTLHLLTLATKERQRAWVRLATDPDETPPPFWQLKAWLLGGAEISTKAALFDEAAYTGAIATDLFGEDRYFTDADEFWRLQNGAIAEMQDKLAASGWREVAVIPPSERFASWDYEPASKAKGGAVIIEVGSDGHVTVHKGLKPRGRSAASRHQASAQEDTPEPETRERPELSAPLANVVDILRHGAVRLALADAPGIALRLVLAHMLSGSQLWTVTAEPQTPASAAIAAWRDGLPMNTAFAERKALALATLGRKDEALVSHDASGARTADILATLMSLPDDDVLALLAVTMAETLTMGTGLIDTLGAALAVDVGAHWQLDDLFFEVCRDREAIGAMLAEVIGDTAARSYLTETGAKKKAIIRMALDGNGRTKVDGWLPRYVRFPMAGYTSRPMLARERAAA